MRRICLVYAGDPHNQARYAPYSITRNLYSALSAHTEVVYYDWCHTGDLDLREDDVFVGHPNYPNNTATRKAFSKYNCHAKFLIHPLHTKRVEDNWPFNDLAMAADGIFSITGPYWYDTLDNTVFKDWKPKITRVDMAIRHEDYPYFREKFNPIGSRSLIYIGSSTPNKNLGYLYNIMASMSDIKLLWVGGSSDHPLYSLPNVEVWGWMDMTPEVGQKIIAKCDAFISVSDSDANPTTLLEAGAWGFPLLCTPESGYYGGDRNNNMFTQVYLGDINRTISEIRNLLNKPEQELLQKTRHTRLMIESDYTWQKFCGTIWNRLEPYVSN